MAIEKSGFLVAHGKETTTTNPIAHRRVHGGGNWRWRLAIVLSLAMVVTMLGCWEAGIDGRRRPMTTLQFPPTSASTSTSAVLLLPPNSNQETSEFDPYQHLGHLSPFFSPPSAPASLRSGTPPSCTATRAFLVHRHGSRNPHADELAVVQGLADYVGSHRGALFANPQADVPSAWSFLARGGGSWNNTLGTDDLTAPGRQQLFDHGVAMRLRYPDLYVEPKDDDDADADADAGSDSDSDLRGALAVAGDEDRVVESAEWFLAGYYGRAAGNGNGNGSPGLRVIPENAETPSWITPHSACSAWDEQYGSNLTERWGAVFRPPIANRINGLLGRAWPGVNFTAAHIHGMFWACAYGTAAQGAGSSPWCGVFTPEELLQNEYEYDLRQRGFSGYGLPGDMGAVLGGLLVGNVTSFLREEGDNRRLSLNFGHDKTLAFGLTALGLADDGDDAFPPEGPVDPHRSWQTARLVPFASYMLWKRLECGDGAESRIQLILNGANYGLGPTGCAMDEYGTCRFEDFLSTDKVKAALNVTYGDTKWKKVCQH